MGGHHREAVEEGGRARELRPLNRVVVLGDLLDREL